MNEGKKTLTSEQVKAVTEYIIFDYDVNVNRISHTKPTVISVERSNVISVTVLWFNGIEKAFNSSADPATHKEDKQILADAEFTLLKSEGFFALSKYVLDICEEIAKNKLDD